MKPGVVFGALFALIVLAILGARFYPRTQLNLPSEPQPSDSSAVPSAEPRSQPNAYAPNATPVPTTPGTTRGASITLPPDFTPASTNRLERLAQLRETFRSLASGNKMAAIKEAQLLTDENERETALLTLVSEWTQGELTPARERARAIARVGLEAGLGMELIKNPELALLWANELTDGPGRAALLHETARALLDSDPAGAFALSEQFPQEARSKFYESLLEAWAEKDTGAAIQWAEQLPDATQRDGAMQSIRR